MSDRGITALGALAALAVLAALLFGGAESAEVGRPTSAEPGPNGYAALARWLDAAGIPVVSVRERIPDWLARDALPRPTGNLLITTLPHRHRLRVPEADALEDWIAAGNSLLILAALHDTPDWALTGDGLFLDDLGRLTGLAFHPADGPRIGSLTEVTAVQLRPRPTHPLMRGVAALEGETDSLATPWTTSPPDDGRPLLELAVEDGSLTAAFWQLPLGDGHVLICGLGSLLGNRSIGRADNRVLVNNLLRYHLAPGAAVVFDDMHQGLSVLYDPQAFFGDPRLGVTLAFLLGFWALYLVGAGGRLVAPRDAPRGAGQQDFVVALGGFLAAKLSTVAAGQLMLRRWFDELRRRGAMPAGGPDAPPSWSALAALATVEPATVTRLRRYHTALERGEAVDLRALHNTIEELRRMLQ